MPAGDRLYAYQSRPEVARFLRWDARDRAQVRAALEVQCQETRLEAEGDWLTFAVVWHDLTTRSASTSIHIGMPGARPSAGRHSRGSRRSQACTQAIREPGRTQLPISGHWELGDNRQVLEGDTGDLVIRRLEEAVCRLRAATAGRERRGLSHDDADDVAGTAATDDAIGFNPLPLLRALHQHGAVVAVIGQVAGIMHGSRELTGDLDLLWDGHPRQAPALAAAFAAAGASLADAEGRPVPGEPAAFSGPKVLFRSPFASGDCCIPALPWGDLPVAAFLARCHVAAGGDGLMIRYLDCADLIRMRRAAGRPKDLRRASELELLATRAGRHGTFGA